MAYQTISNVSIRGISACVPEHIEENKGLPVFSDGEDIRVIAQTGIERKHTIIPGSNTTISDLCEKAFEVLIDKLGWERESIEALVLTSSTGDYITPATSNYLQGKLNLSEDCIAFDIRQGCPGWIVGLDVVSSLVSNGFIRRAILLCGDASTLMSSPKDKESKPLFGDAGTATALEFNPEAPILQFHHGTRGKDFEAIITPEGGLRKPFSDTSLEYVEYGNNILRRGIDCKMDGMSVFGFGMSVAPKSVISLMEHFGLEMDNIDYYLFHQANNYMNEKIRKKLKIPTEKVPYSLKDFGNTSCASIPLTIITQCREEFKSRKLNNIGCAFGVGLSWASVHFETDYIVCPDLVLY